MGLFKEAILAELGFDQKTYHETLVLSTLVGLASQLLSGWIGWKWSLPRLMAVAMGLYAASLLWLPHVTTHTQLWGNAVLMGVAGGIVTVVFFAIWANAFGRIHRAHPGGREMLTVVSSAVGPLLFAELRGAIRVVLNGIPRVGADRACPGICRLVRASANKWRGPTTRVSRYGLIRQRKLRMGGASRRPCKHPSHLVRNDRPRLSGAVGETRL